MLHVAFHGLHEVWDEVVPALELNVNLRPGVFDNVSQLHQTVIDPDHPEKDEENDTDDRKRKDKINAHLPTS
jgi:hypothetical protein